MLNNKIQKFLHCMLCNYYYLWYVGILCLQGGGAMLMFPCGEVGWECGDGCNRRHLHTVRVDI